MDVLELKVEFKKIKSLEEIETLDINLLSLLTNFKLNKLIVKTYTLTPVWIRHSTISNYRNHIIKNRNIKTIQNDTIFSCFNKDLRGDFNTTNVVVPKLHVIKSTHGIENTLKTDTFKQQSGIIILTKAAQKFTK